MSSTMHDDRAITANGRLPMLSLLALFAAGFLGILNETVPAGLLPKMSADLGRPESVAGQTITVYALAAAATAIPLNAALKNVGRRTVLASSLGVFAAANLVIGDPGGESDEFQALAVTAFNVSIAAGGVFGGSFSPGPGSDPSPGLARPS